MEIKRITITERGPVPRRMAKYHRAASKAGYQAAAEYHHRVHTPKRFTVAHGREANYRPRSGENLPYGSKAFWRSYYGRKLKGQTGGSKIWYLRDVIREGTAAPLVWTGETRHRARVTTISVTANRANLRYNVNALSYRVFPQEEFRRIIPRELAKLGQVFDDTYNKAFNDNNEVTKRNV